MYAKFDIRWPGYPSRIQRIKYSNNIAWNTIKFLDGSIDSMLDFIKFD
jgi:hypothetical protein